jgi:hypothetical protein
MSMLNRDVALPTAVGYYIPYYCLPTVQSSFFPLGNLAEVRHELRHLSDFLLLIPMSLFACNRGFLKVNVV